MDLASTLPATRYSLKPDRHSSHSQIAAWLKRYRAQAMPERACIVLDIGCAEGFLGQLLGSPDFWLIGIDSNGSALARVPEIYRQRIVAVMEAGLTLALNRTPDVLVLADVLEHIREPETCLKSLLLRHLAPGARVVISVPNIAHLYVRLSLLAGRFRYADRGILDLTHLRFFTWQTGLAMCRTCGIRVDEVAATPVPLPLVHPLFEPGQLLEPMHTLNAWLASAFKTLLAYQMIIYGTYIGYERSDACGNSRN